VLYAVRRRGEATVEQVAGQLSMTVSGARQHLSALARDGYVDVTDNATTGAKRGRRSLVYSVNGTGVTKSIKREVFGAEPTCTFTSASRAAATNYQDLWWGGESESGWGVNLTHQGNTIFATLFTYATNGKGMWLVATMAKQTDGSFSGDLLQRWDLHSTHRRPLPRSVRRYYAGGHDALRSPTASRERFTYSVNGTQVVKFIQREVWGTPTVCN
jgi:DNA-binding MarR family transcriptional regulator